MEYISGMYTDIGSSRKSNQDSLCIMQANYKDNKILMAIVCDGMGGLEKGEVASSAVVECFVKWFEEELPKLPVFTLQYIRARWGECLTDISNKINKFGSSNNFMIGTTFTGIFFINDEYFWVHVGDSRLYVFENEQAKQLTKDHTVVAREVENGTITLEEAKHNRAKNKLTQCIGASKQLQPNLGFGKATHGNIFLLCSDGLYHKLMDHELSKSYWDNANTSRELESLLYETVRNIIRRGEKDNVSAVMIKV